ncbi:hypothetical protein SAY87_028105 [Trapa incisa]|uniref:Uncharacterized protein n=1 Tax=Trapa incisa TaxID=236973 RepID=A0AAN7QPI6_9MYRT|nr:hypothetical protein SAY87_028105 [Trapa incisa]
MVFAYGGLLPCFWRIVQRAAKLDTRKSSTGLIIGVALAAICLTYTKLMLYGSFALQAESINLSCFLQKISLNHRRGNTPARVPVQESLDRA